MFTYRKAQIGERDKYLDFANMVFSMAHRPHDFAALLPKVYGKDKRTEHFQNIAVDDAGNIRALIAVLPGKMNVNGTVLNTGYVGTVSSHPAARGEGHMKALMNMAIEGMKAEGCDIAMLGGQRQRYEYFGFTRGGIERAYSVNSANVRHALKDIDETVYAFAPLSGVYVEKALALHDERDIYAIRTAENFEEICRSWYGKPYAILKDGEFAGYCVAIGETIAELCLCDEEDLFGTIKAYMKFANAESIRLVTGDCDSERNAGLAEIAEDVNISMAQQIRVFSFKKVIGAYMSLKAEYFDMADGEVSFSIDGEEFTVKVSGGNVDVTDAVSDDKWQLSAMSAQRLFFDIDGRVTTGELPLGWAPLPLRYDQSDEF